MDVKEVRPKVDPETCTICGRRLLQGESVNWYVTPDSVRRAVCELCIPRAERARWVRERDGEEVVQLRPVRGERRGMFSRVAEFFGGAEPDETDEFADRPAPARRREQRASRRRESEEVAPPPLPPRDVRAVPTEPEARLEQGIELFNLSQFPRTIAGLTRSLGDAQVAVFHNTDGTVEVIVGWDIAWYSYRVTLGDATEPVEQSGRGNDVAELVGRVTAWNAAADGFGRLFLIEAGDTPESGQSSESSDLGVGDDRPL